MTSETILGFLCGADMNPERMLDSPVTAQARFVAIAAAPDTVAQTAGLPISPGSAEIWGILVEGVNPESARHDLISVRHRNGETVVCRLLTTPATVGLIADILAEARYWELPLAYRDQLATLEPVEQ